MRLTRTFGTLLFGATALFLAKPAVARLWAEPPSAAAQDQAPNRREITVTAGNFRFTPDRIEVTQDDLVKLTIQSQDVAYSLTIDEYRVSRRVPPGGTTTFEFRADQPGTFRFYSNLTSDGRHREMGGQLIVRAR